MKPSSAIKQTSDRLIDQEPGFAFATWSQPQLLAAFNWSLSVIADLRPEVFATPIKVLLPTGNQVKLSECDRFMPPYTLLDRQGNFIRDLVQGSVRGSLRTRKLCGAESGPYYFTRITDRIFEIFPALDDNEKGLQVEGTCLSTPRAEHMEDDIDIPGYLDAAVLELMMHYSHMYDIEAAPSRDRAAIHWNNAMLLINPGVKKNAN